MRDPWEGRSVDGMIETGAAVDRIHPSFRTLLTAADGAVSSVAPEASLYLYGSVATGQAEVGRSDVDLLVIGLDADRAGAASSDLSGRFVDLCRGVEIGAARHDDFVGEHDEAYGNRVFLRHYCVLVYGSERDRPVHDFPADTRAARGFNGDIAQHRDRWRSDLDTSSDPGVLANRIARKTLLALAGLVSVHDRTWTTNRATAVSRWAEIEPARSAPLGTLLGWTAGSPDVGGDDVGRMLDETIEPLVERFATEIGLWS